MKVEVGGKEAVGRFEGEFLAESSADLFERLDIEGSSESGSVGEDGSSRGVEDAATSDV